MGGLLVIIGLILLLATAYHTLGVVLLIVGAILLFAPGPYSGTRRWPGHW